MENKDILFSVVVPIYNIEEYLDDCIKSVLNQIYGFFELILVDDGSTDNSFEICDSYAKKDKRIKVIHKTNGGLVSARKAGVAVAKGEYAVCLDGDDWIAKNHLLELSKVIKEYSPDIICFNHIELSSDKKIEKTIPFRKGYYSKKNIVDEIYPQLIHTAKGTTFPPTIWAKVYKMELYRQEQLSVDNQIKIGEDVACTIPCIVDANSIYILDKSLYYYRRNNISMTKNKKPFSWDVPELIELHLRERIKFDEADFQEQISRRTVHALLNVVKTQFYRHDRYYRLAKEINSQLMRPIYNNAIDSSHFSPFTALGFFHFCLKHRLIFPIYVLSKIR